MSLHARNRSHRCAGGFVLAAATAAFAVTAQAQRSNLPDENMVTLAQKAWIGDLDGMIKRRMIRVLVPPSKTHYFIDKGVQRGITFDASTRRAQRPRPRSASSIGSSSSFRSTATSTTSTGC